MALPADSHVHTEWFWDAPDGSTEATCALAVPIGLPAVAFKYADYTIWEIHPQMSSATGISRRWSRRTAP